jgi:hypothetical protein
VVAAVLLTGAVARLAGGPTVAVISGNIDDDLLDEILAAGD